MQILTGIDGLRSLAPNSVLSIGNFDGVHRGHLRIIELARKLSRANGRARGRIAVVTFEPHPLTVLAPHRAPPRLTMPAEKSQLLESLGVDDLVVLAPTREVLDLTAEQFWKILRDEVRPSHLIEGNSFTFGHDRAGTIDSLREWSAGTAIELHVVDSVDVVLLNLQIVEVSSSLIRWLIARGRVRDAAIALGRPYAISGKVVAGAQRGRTIGAPTANLQLGGQLSPGDGVYAGGCVVDGESFAAAVSIGTLPTFDGQSRQIEAHLLDFSGDLYGKTLGIDLVDWLRDQQKFRGVEPLKIQIARDIKETRTLASVDPAKPIVETVFAEKRG